MRHQLAVGLVSRFERRAGQFELSAGLERDRSSPGHVRQAYDVRPVHDRLPAEQVLHPDQQSANRALALVGNGIVLARREGKLLVLGADAEFLLRLRPLFEPSDELVARFDRGQVDNVTGHSGDSGGKGRRPYTRPAGKSNAAASGHLFTDAGKDSGAGRLPAVLPGGSGDLRVADFLHIKGELPRPGSMGIPERSFGSIPDLFGAWKP